MTTARHVFLVAASLVATFSCSSDSVKSTSSAVTSDGSPEGSPAACTAEMPDACPAPSPKYATDVVPILEAKCNTCHDGKDGGPWPLTNHTDVIHWKTQVTSALIDCTMPPSTGTETLTSAERTTLIDWLACGAPDN